MTEQNRWRAVRLFVVILALTAIANGPGNNIFSNYFNEVYHIDSVQRGFIEIPRESPGILCMVLVAAVLVFFGFRIGFFNFGSKTILPFAIGAGAIAGAIVLLAIMAIIASPIGHAVGAVPGGRRRDDGEMKIFHLY